MIMAFVFFGALNRMQPEPHDDESSSLILLESMCQNSFALSYVTVPVRWPQPVLHHTIERDINPWKTKQPTTTKDGLRTKC